MIATESRQPDIPPVLILSTGRCGSTMLSEILNRHPAVLSVAEFFSAFQMAAFGLRRPSGEEMWRLFSQQTQRNRLALRESFGELLYPFDEPGARYTLRTIPPILALTLPHITDRHEELYAELEPVVRAQGRRSPADQYRALFSWLAVRFDRRVWVERSGGSLLLAPILTRNFPEARIVHIYRDGRNTAISLSGHAMFRGLLAKERKLRSWRVDPVANMPFIQRWNRLGYWLDNLADRFIDLDKLPYDEVSLPDFARFWSDLIRLGHRTFGHFPADRLLNMRFEDVQADPKGQIRRLIRFISPELEDESWLREVAKIPKPSTRSRFDDLSDEEQAAVTEACRPGLELLGYPS